ncbi:O-antigen ligase family protein [Faecalibacter macacae]|nr:O-antigen ligase family protein [Faecalibacter macacae]
MIVSQERYNLINQILIVLIASTIVFRPVCTILLIIFSLFNLINYKHINLDKRYLKDMLIIGIPFLLSLLFIFLNDNILQGLKTVEKVLILIIFPLTILTNRNLNIKSILNYYRKIFIVLLIFFLIRFIVIYPDKIEKYINGIDLIEIGYQYAISLGTHAPALNMHIAFLTIVNFYFLVQSILKKKMNNIIYNIILFLIAFSFILIVNTRIALINIFLGCLIVLFFEFVKIYSFKKTILISIISLITFVGITAIYTKINPYMLDKYSTVTFDHMDKIGKLDEIENPEIVVFNALVTRVSIWKASYEVVLENLPFGTGAADGKKELNKYFERTNQQFLAKYEFPIHNQILDYGIKFGFFGILGVLVYLLYPIYKFLRISIYQSLFLSFGVIFFISNLTDDFLIRFDGIVFSGLFYTLFSSISYKKY